MKKLELMEILINNDVLTSNLRTFLRKNAKKLSISQSEETIRKWLSDYERKQSKKRLKADQKKEADFYKMSVKQYVFLVKKAETFLEDFHTGHSMGCYRSLIIRGFSRPFAYNHTLSSYANSCRFSPTYGDIDITLTKKELINIEKIHGVWTIKGKQHKCTWLEGTGSKQYYFVKRVDGFLFGESHSDTLIGAKNLFRKAFLAKKEEEQNNKKFVGINHLQKIGACMPGITAFANRHNLNLEFGYNLLFLKNLEPNNVFLQKL